MSLNDYNYLVTKIISEIGEAENKLNQNRFDISIERFEILGVIKNKDNYQIYKVSDTVNKNIYCLKRYDKRRYTNLNYFSQLKNELNIASKYSNDDNIVKTYYVFQDDNYMYKVDEFMLYGSLDYLVKSGNIMFCEHDVQVITASILLALKHLYNNNIIHNYISLKSVYINELKVVKLGNFKHAVIGNSNKCVNILSGVSAPEIIFTNNCSFLSDCFSLGMLCYYLNLKKVLLKRTVTNVYL